MTTSITTSTELLAIQAVGSHWIFDRAILVQGDESGVGGVAELLHGLEILGRFGAVGTPPTWMGYGMLDLDADADFITRIARRVLDQCEDVLADSEYKRRPAYLGYFGETAQSARVVLRLLGATA